ncbi:UNKNOWN [Stylonychia lemnae]|uniref:Uncharacterized protein n=1 Tax=Stylonychia lemnae TaxID=5949 RepID=A0A078B0Z5_STYLE|nr:UNKNOWN [Stylonychia lemnae]|eukprot:CDW88001.1 UNKNOWN [Stylonychia lemnae]
MESTFDQLLSYAIIDSAYFVTYLAVATFVFVKTRFSLDQFSKKTMILLAASLGRNISYFILYILFLVKVAVWLSAAIYWNNIKDGNTFTEMIRFAPDFYIVFQFTKDFKFFKNIRYKNLKLKNKSWTLKDKMQFYEQNMRCKPIKKKRQILVKKDKSEYSGESQLLERKNYDTEEIQHILEQTFTTGQKSLIKDKSFNQTSSQQSNLMSSGEKSLMKQSENESDENQYSQLKKYKSRERIKKNIEKASQISMVSDGSFINPIGTVITSKQQANTTADRQFLHSVESDSDEDNDGINNCSDQFSLFLSNFDKSRAMVIKNLLNWNYLTKRFVLQNYRDFIAVSLITSFATSKLFAHFSKSADNYYILQRVYTHDETDINFKNPLNKTDQAVRREKLFAFRQHVLENRAKKEREQEQRNSINFKQDDARCLQSFKWEKSLSMIGRIRTGVIKAR